jgi:hypothetical protein
MTEIERLKRENAVQSAIIYSLVRQFGENGNVLLKNCNDELPNRLLVGVNTIGDDVIVTIIEGEALEQLEVQRGEDENTQDD